VRSKSLDRELGAIFYTFYELARNMGLRRFAPHLAVVLLVATGGTALLVLLDLIAHAAGRVSMWPISQAPRSIAGVAILGGYFIWDRFASPERIALLQSLHSTSSPQNRKRRRLKAAALVLILSGSYLALSGI
jgi:hypothetical protein